MYIMYASDTRTRTHVCIHIYICVYVDYHHDSFKTSELPYLGVSPHLKQASNLMKYPWHVLHE